MPRAEDQRDAGGFLAGIRVLELADELGEYCGKVLAGLGADVVKVEAPAGEVTRTYGPFYRDEPHPDRSLHFWHYNFAKRGIVLDLDRAEGQEDFRRLARDADVIVDSRPRKYLAERGLGYDDLRGANPGLIHVRISPFGDDGPWADYKACDLVHLALGGVIMNCGYDPEPDGRYDTPPVAPQMWQAYHIAGEHAAIGALGALAYRFETGRGQRVSVAVHQAVSANTEADIPDWVYQRIHHRRQTCRHSFAAIKLPALSRTKDGRWLLPYRTYLPPSFGDPFAGTVRLLERHGFADDLTDSRYEDTDYRRQQSVNQHVGALTDQMVGSYLYSTDLWAEAQEEGLPWAPCRRPEENLFDEHFRQRNTFMKVEHPELGETFDYVGAKWLAPEVPWRAGPRAPLLGEHTTEILQARPRPRPAVATGARDRELSKLGKPFALSGVRVIDLAWLLASGGAGRFLTAMGAEVIKVEHESRWDGMRFGAGVAPDGGRAARDGATAPLPTPADPGPNSCGGFMEINTGKTALSLNLKSKRGKQLLIELIKDADMVIEGFSPGTMDRMGLGYERLSEINPKIIYVQQSGMGQIGTYGRLRSYGPTAQAFTGLSEMSGLPEPFAPAGIGYSYLDWFGAYNMALAMLAALHRQRTTGAGCWIDSSQAESGTYLTGTAVLDHSANGREWSRYGNRSPFRIAAPHGVYPVAGDDRWIAIACFDEEEWRALVSCLGARGLLVDERFLDLDARVRNQDVLDVAIADLTAGMDPWELMEALQCVGVPAGVCQTAQDRCERDPQLEHLGWMVELAQSEIGTWPAKEVPIHFAESPVYAGGSRDRHGPNYGEDNAYVLGDLLGLDGRTQIKLREEGAL